MVTQVTQDVAGLAEEEEDEEEKTRGSIMVGMPIEMKQMVQAAAKEAGTSTQGYVREMLAEKIGFTGPLTKGRVRETFEGTPEERKAQRKAITKARREVFGKLLAKYSGNLDLLAAELLAGDDEEDEEDE